MNRKIEYKELPLQIKRDSMTEDGKFEGYASMFGVVDLGDDVVQRGAFVKSLAERGVKLLWQHDMHQPIGVWEEVREDEKGLFVKGRILQEVQKGKEALALMRAGAIDSMSIGFRTVHSEWLDDGVRKLIELELFEISLVTFPMLPSAKVTDVKSIETEREFERFLRDAGFSRKQAAAIALHGYKAVRDQRDADDDDQRDAEAEKRAAEDTKKFLASLKQLRSKFHA